LGLPARPTSADQRASVDPILTNGRIPPQDVPVPGKDGFTLDRRRDPLFGSPAGPADRPADKVAGPGRRNPPKPTEETSSSAPPRVGVPYRPGKSATPAALASRLDPADPTYNLTDDPPPVSIGRGLPAGELLRELKALGVTVAPPKVERGEYVARGEVELDPAGRPGVRRAYETAAATADVALRKLLDQVKEDARR
jgi:hypothetical protein